MEYRGSYRPCFFYSHRMKGCVNYNENGWLLFGRRFATPAVPTYRYCVFSVSLLWIFSLGLKVQFGVHLDMWVQPNETLKIGDTFIGLVFTRMSNLQSMVIYKAYFRFIWYVKVTLRFEKIFVIFFSKFDLFLYV